MYIQWLYQSQLKYIYILHRVKSSRRLVFPLAPTQTSFPHLLHSQGINHEQSRANARSFSTDVKGIGQSFEGPTD